MKLSKSIDKLANDKVERDLNVKILAITQKIQKDSRLRIVSLRRRRGLLKIMRGYSLGKRLFWHPLTGIQG